jgi:PAS domain S-box-containing protein
MRKINLLKAPLQKIILGIILILGGFYLHYTWTKFKVNQAEEALQIARSIVATFPKEDLKTLEAKSNDIDKPQYQAVKSTLKSIIRVNPNARFAYLYIQKNKKLYFLGDSEPEKSKDYSPPGQEYSEADKAYSQPFENGKELIVGPATDRWGTWISALIPIKNEVTGKTIAVFAMDFNSNSWNTAFLYDVTESIVLIVLLLITFLFLILIKDKNKNLKEDIGKRKKIEQQLIESETLLRTIIQTVPECIKMIDEHDRLVLMNPAGLEIIDADTFEQIDGKKVFDVIAPEYHNSFSRMHKQVLAGESVEMEFEVTGLKGIRKWVETSAVPMHYNGKMVQLAHTRNITKRKRTEELLRDSKIFLNETQKIANLGTYILDIERDTWKSSEILDAILGIDSNYDKTTQGWTSVVHPEWQQKMYDYFVNEVISRKCKFDKEYKIIRKNDKEERWVHGLGEVQYNETNQPIKMIGTIQDITKRKRTEELLRDSKIFLNETQKIAHLGTYILDLQNNTWKTSAILNHILGIDLHYQKSSKDWISFVHPDWHQIMYDYFTKEVIPNKSKFNIEYKIIRQHDKEERWVHALGEVQYNEKNQAVKMIGTIQDITDRKRDEQELIIAKEKAEESDRLKSAFLANMSHEIRTPMNGIMGFAELLKEPNLTGEEQQEFIGIIEKSGTRMLNIINDIIDISKIESGLMTVSISETNINEQMEYIYNFFKPEVDQKGVGISFKNDLPTNKAIIKTDREKIYAILTNLVKNAIKFTSSGEIEFGYSLKSANRETAGMSGFLFESFELEFYVKDSGIGIQDEQLDIVFERFRQASESLTRHYEGAGLGLSISKAFVEMLGGKIWAESKKGEGSTFYFTIPYNVEENQQNEITKIIPTNNLENQIKKLNIIIAEDDEISAKLLTKSIGGLAKKLLRARTGSEAIELIRNNPEMDMILMDIQMPGMDGYETTRQIRKFNTEIIIIAQTAYALTDDKGKTLEAGCNDYISKPIKKEELMILMQKYFKEQPQPIATDA